MGMMQTEMWSVFIFPLKDVLVVNFFDDLGWLANLAGILSFIALIWTAFSVHVLRTEQVEGNKKITLLLEVEKQPSRCYTIPGTVRRQDFSRAEIMGRLGMIPRKDKNAKGFDLKYVQQNPRFLEDIETIYNRKDDAIMTILCSESEFEQFQF